MLNRAADGDSTAAEVLLPLVYDDLRAAAGALFQGQNAGHTLQPTALVHEAYVRLISGRETTYECRRHFFAVAAMAMRQVLANHARDARRLKRGGGARRVSLTESEASSAIDRSDDADFDLVDLDDALTELASLNERHARIVEMRFLAGLSTDDIAGQLGVSRRTVELDWRTARAWLRTRLDGAARA